MMEQQIVESAGTISKLFSYMCYRIKMDDSITFLNQQATNRVSSTETASTQVLPNKLLDSSLFEAKSNCGKTG